MAIQAVTQNTVKKVSNTPVNNDRKSQIKVNTGVALTSALGVAGAVALIAKKQGFSLSPSKIKNTPVKDWAIFGITEKLRPEKKVMKLEWAEIMTLGIASVTGGLIGGAIFDKKENFKTKCYEAVSQLIGDITIPLSFVALPTLFYKKFEDLSDSTTTKHLKLQNVSKVIKNNKFLRVATATLVSGSSLAAGIITGNRVSNKLNGHFSGEEVDRGIRLTDFAPHLDDVCLAITLMAEKSPFGDIVSKFVPIALTVAGIETGTANPDNRENKY